MISAAERVLKLSGKNTGKGYTVTLPTAFAKDLGISTDNPFVYRVMGEMFGCPIIVFYPCNDETKNLPFIGSNSVFNSSPSYFISKVLVNYRSGDDDLKHPIFRLQINKSMVEEMFKNVHFGLDEHERYVKMTIDMSVPCIRLIPYNKH